MISLVEVKAIFPDAEILPIPEQRGDEQAEAVG